MFAIFKSQLGLVSDQIAYTIVEPQGIFDPRILQIEANSNGDLDFSRFEETLPDGVYNGDEGF